MARKSPNRSKRSTRQKTTLQKTTLQKTTLQKTTRSTRTKPSKRSQHPAKGWAKLSPKKGTQRHEMMKKCGKKCFLDPQNEGYPICAYTDEPVCKIDYTGVLSAYVRSRQWKHAHVETLAKKLLDSQKKK
jgi:hypothetical protein